MSRATLFSSTLGERIKVRGNVFFSLSCVELVTRHALQITVLSLDYHKTILHNIVNTAGMFWASNTSNFPSMTNLQRYTLDKVKITHARSNCRRHHRLNL